MSEDKPDKTEAEAKADAVIFTIEEIKSHRRENPKGFRQALRRALIRLGLTWLFSRGK